MPPWCFLQGHKLAVQWVQFPAEKRQESLPLKRESMGGLLRAVVGENT